MPSRPAVHTAPTTCSAYSARLGEPLAGTAPSAVAWLAIEQPGPWGARALTESHLDRGLGAELSRRAEGTGVRIALIRRVGHHALTSCDAPRTVLICDTRPGFAAVRSFTVPDPRDLLDLDLAALGSGRLETGTPRPDPLILVCTNGKRDRCCALLGRSLALDLAEPGSLGAADVWEADHLGGHRFAPTALVLPTGYVYGRIDAATAMTAVGAASRGQVVTAQARGRSTWSRAGQAADLALRTELQEFGADAVRVVGEQRLDGERWSVDLVSDEIRYRAFVEESNVVEARPESCGKTFGNPAHLHVTALEKAQ
ncbi:MAG TPA: sucrase ferredoxin [Actinocrinis sp.]|uniref:sucrase ferredoxin n=1 Tax=Actinocrinis sp. TaxID=1920516 RepID=UPI002DDD39D1|nr:sucrase ferredoxin [Actinocrinis sp.]HEV2345941.1 sucrase ferredoxin [Actinocrinis sp.]